MGAVFFISGEAAAEDIGDDSLDGVLDEDEDDAEEYVKIGNTPTVPNRSSGGKEDALMPGYITASFVLSFGLVVHFTLDRFEDLDLVELSGTISTISKGSSGLPASFITPVELGGIWLSVSERRIIRQYGCL